MGLSCCDVAADWNVSYRSEDEQSLLLKNRVTDLTSDRKKLTAQVRYLRAKFARENTFKNGLTVQKHYLLRLVGQFRQRYVPCIQMRSYRKY